MSYMFIGDFEQYGLHAKNARARMIPFASEDVKIQEMYPTSIDELEEVTLIGTNVPGRTHPTRKLRTFFELLQEDQVERRVIIWAWKYHSGHRFLAKDTKRPGTEKMYQRLQLGLSFIDPDLNTSRTEAEYLNEHNYPFELRCQLSASGYERTVMVEQLLPKFQRKMRQFGRVSDIYMSMEPEIDDKGVLHVPISTAGQLTGANYLRWMVDNNRSVTDVGRFKYAPIEEKVLTP